MNRWHIRTLAIVASFIIYGCEGESMDDLTVEECRTTINMEELVDEDGDLPQLPPPISASEITSLRESFRWENTSALPENNSSGQPALHYAIILIDDPESEEILRISGIHFDGMPLFEEELEPYSGKVGTVELQSDGKSAALYAIIPAGAYNVFREEALDGNDVVGPIILRDSPTQEALLPDGTLSYSYLVERGFTNGQSVDVILDPSLEVAV